MNNILIISLLLTTGILLAASPSSIRIPVKIERAIKVRAETKWPSNYEMQVYTVKNQKSAYKEIMNWATKNRKSHAKKIKAAAETKWPGNYEMQWYTIKNQIAAYNELNK